MARKFGGGVVHIGRAFLKRTIRLGSGQRRLGPPPTRQREGTLLSRGALAEWQSEVARLRRQRLADGAAAEKRARDEAAEAARLQREAVQKGRQVSRTRSHDDARREAEWAALATIRCADAMAEHEAVAVQVAAIEGEAALVERKLAEFRAKRGSSQRYLADLLDHHRMVKEILREVLAERAELEEELAELAPFRD